MKKKIIDLIVIIILLGLILVIVFAGDKLQTEDINKAPVEQKIVLEEVGDLNIARADHSAILLSNGNVLFLGGSGGKYSNITGEIYNSKTKSVSFVANYSPLDIKQNTPILLDNSNVIIFCSEGIVKYNAKLNKFGLIKKHKEKMAYNTISKLSNDKILVIGGKEILALGRKTINEKPQYNIARIYNLKNNSFKVVGHTNLKRTSSLNNDNIIKLKNNKLLIIDTISASFFKQNNSEIYNPLNNSFKLVSKFPKIQAKNEFNYLPSKFLLYDSKKQEYMKILELLKTQNKEFQEQYPYGSNGDSSLLINNKIILTISNYSNNLKEYTKVYSFNILSKKFEYLGDLQLNYQGFTLTKLPNNKILVSGGYHYDGSDEYKSIKVKRNVVINIKKIGE